MPVYIGAPNFEPFGLPSGYTQLDYIRGTGSSYFDSGFNATYRTRVEAKFNVESNGWLYGSRNATTGSGTQQFAAFVYNATQFYSSYFKTTVYGQAYSTRGKVVIDHNRNVLQYNDVAVTNTSRTSGACAIPMYIFSVNTSGEAGTCLTGKLYYFKIYDNDVLVRDYVPCKDSNGVVGLYDLVNASFISSATSTPFEGGLPPRTPVAHEVKKIYVGIDGVARTIRRAYIGVGGVARPCWTNGDVAYYGTATALSSARSGLAATTVGNYALFGGGVTNPSYYGDATSVVDAYNGSLVRSKPAALYEAQNGLTATTVGNYALFAGGRTASYPPSNRVTAYNQSLTQSFPDPFINGLAEQATTTVGNYALFISGVTGSGGNPNTAYVYDASLTRSELLTSKSVKGLAATTHAGRALVGASTTMDAIDESLTVTSIEGFSSSRSRSYCAATTVGDYSVFAGGGDYRTAAYADAYSKSLVRSTATNLSVTRANMRAVLLGGRAMFCGGSLDSVVFDTVETYDESLTLGTAPSLSVARLAVAVTTIGKYALIAGGSPATTGSAALNVVDVYTT